MCGRYRLNRADLAAAAIDATPMFEEFSERRIIHNMEFIPSNLVPIVRLELQQRVMEMAAWGFVPSWASEAGRAKPINAKSETVATSAMFKKSFTSQRCLLPTDGFFEPKGPKGRGRRQQFFFQRPDTAIFAMAGIWSRRHDGITCAILTTTPNETVRPIHERMPVIVQVEDYQRWLDPSTEPDQLQDMMKPSPADQLVAEPEDVKPKEAGLFD